jgi:hypothetical protein
VTIWTETLVEEQLRTAVSPSQAIPNDWLAWLEPEDAAIVRARMQGAPWKVICWRFGLSRPTAHRRWQHAVRLITWRLIGNPPPVRSSRRAFAALHACDTTTSKDIQRKRALPPSIRTGLLARG